MTKTIAIGIVLWLILFTARIISMGGLDPGYQEMEVGLLTSYQVQFTDRIDTLLPSPQSSLLAGILLGERSSLPYELRQALTNTSTIHMVVVSGQNLTILGGMLMGFASILGRKKTIGLTLAGMIIYALLTGLQIPVLRAFIMATAVLLAQLLGKQVVGWWVLVICASIMLLFNPNWVFSISFQLSFLATLGLVSVAPLISQALKRLPSLIRQDLAVTLAAQLMTAPVIAANFHSLSLVGVGANILVLWTIPLVMVSGFLALVTSYILPPIAPLTALVPATLLTYFIYIVELFSKLPMATVFIPDVGWIGWAGCYLILTGILWHLRSDHGKEV